MNAVINPIPFRDRLVRLPELCAMLGIKRSTAYDWIKAGRLPPPIKPGGPGTRTSAWRGADIEKLIQAQAEGGEQ